MPIIYDPPSLKPLPRASSLLLSVSPDNRYLVDGNGQPFLLWGTSAWNIVNENLAVETARSPSGVYRSYVERLDTDAAKGFNSTQIQLVSRYQSNAPNNANGVAPFTTPNDLSTWNQPYFDFARTIVQYAGTKGIVCQIAPLWMGFNAPQGWYDALEASSNAAIDSYGAAVMSMFGDLDNIIWIGAGDRPGTEPHSTVKFQRLIDAMRTVNDRHLWTHHWNFAPSRQYTLTPRNINGCYEWGNSWDESSTSVDAQVAAEYAINDGPAVVLETLYELNDGQYSSRGSRAAIMQSWLRGCKGYTWSHEGIWHCGALDANLPSQSQGKAYALSTTDCLEFVNCKALLDAVPAHLIEPSKGAGQLLTSSSFGTWAAKTPSGSHAVLYSKGNDMDVDRTKMAGSFNAFWYDITTGGYTPVGGGPFPNTGTQTFSQSGLGTNSRGETDRALLLEAA